MTSSDLGRSTVRVTPAQADAIAALAKLHGAGEIRLSDHQASGFVWFRTLRHDWLISTVGALAGWNDINPVGERQLLQERHNR